MTRIGVDLKNMKPTVASQSEVDAAIIHTGNVKDTRDFIPKRRFFQELAFSRNRIWTLLQELRGRGLYEPVRAGETVARNKRAADAEVTVFDVVTVSVTHVCILYRNLSVERFTA
jgi:hypothetical protein